ncbi:uncharacterized protein LOC143751954 [Siphateles boraxobius]|uniref:uncharacterized protein LOC143751954 n=1 Tax=Siphateles boraxobius TaxID=180520 RepID=UPI004063F93C
MATILENLTDGGSKKDRIRLAKERREEKDRSQAVREQALWEKEQRAQQQYERSVVERGRRLEEQRQKEMHRRSAVEEKRRQRVEEEKVRGYTLWGICSIAQVFHTCLCIPLYLF